MTTPIPIQLNGVTKTFGNVHAVENVTATIHPGQVTGFLGPNGAGKTTTLRILLGLVAATSGSATFGGTAYRDLASPLTTVGAALEAASFHPGRSGRNHLAVYATAARIPKSRIAIVLDMVGLTSAADRRVGGYSLGMRQRLGLAYALLGDPQVIVLDEPINGLDPEGIKWIRGFLKQLAAEGRTVLISSHMLSEVQQTVDEVLVIRNGKLVYTGSLTQLESRHATAVLVASPTPDVLQSALVTAGFAPQQTPTGFLVPNANAAAIGHLAFTERVELHELQQQNNGLEDTFLELMSEGDTR